MFWAVYNRFYTLRYITKPISLHPTHIRMTNISFYLQKKLYLAVTQLVECYTHFIKLPLTKHDEE